ncbi:outer membrane beta-barrel protein [Flavobacteriaceae bacterium KMM 6897]|nr:outer membrane beta-barrel protein [Flavobacteriaceae bacterium KMM 6897]
MKKNLDNLFQEKLTDLHELPNENVWNSIEASLDKNKKSRRILPLWWTMGGVAAFLAILFYITQPKVEDLNSNTIISDTEQRNSAPSDAVDENPNRILETKEETLTTIETSEKDKKRTEDGSVGAMQQKDSWTATSTSQKAISKSNGNSSNNLISPTIINQKQGSFASRTHEDASKTLGKTENSSLISEISSSKIKSTPTDNVVEMDSKENTLDPNTLASEATKIVNQKPQESKASVAKKSIYDEISAQEKEKEIVDTDLKKWSLEPSVAPVYFNGFGSGSPIHPDFSSNSKSGNVNLSYGVFVSYEVSKKLSVRSGVHKVDYGYNTNDVKFTSSFAATRNNSLANIDYAANASNLIVVSTSNDKPSSNIQGEISGKTPSKNGSMIQQFGYLEIPLEVNYALLDKNFGIHIVGGFSSLFLTNNAVLLEADGLNTEIGEANNINDVNFSSNIGFGLNYKFTPKIKLNIEPVFKYQLNTFSNSAGDFKPFSIGIYSGFNFKF